MNSLSLIRRGVTSGSNRPDRLIGNDAPRECVVSSHIDHGLQLGHDHRFGSQALAFGQGFAHTKNRDQAGIQRSNELGADAFIGFTQQLTSLGMSNQDVRHAGIQQHCTTDLAGSCAIFALSAQVLRAQHHARGLAEHALDRF